MQYSSNSKGNVLFLILIAVALFAALSYAVTSSSRSGGGNADGEKAEMIASQILQYMTSIKTARDRMILTGGYDQVRFSVLNGASDPALIYSGQNSTAGKAGGVFDPLPDGGGIPLMFFPASWRAASGNGVIAWHVSPVSVNGVNVGTTEGDEYVLVNYLTDAICKALNQKLIGSKTIPVLVNGGSVGGVASQSTNNANLTINVLGTNGGTGRQLTDYPVCASNSGINILFYPMADH